MRIETIENTTTFCRRIKKQMGAKWFMETDESVLCSLLSGGGAFSVYMFLRYAGALSDLKSQRSKWPCFVERRKEAINAEIWWGAGPM